MEVLPYYSARLIQQHEWWRYWTLEEIVHFVLFQICFSAPVDLVIKGLEESTGLRKFWGAKHFCKEGKEKITIPMFFEKTGRPRYPLDHFLEKLPKEAVAKIKPEYKYKGILKGVLLWKSRH